MLFTVIVNSYNGAPWIAEAIDTVLAQDFADWEMIVWDDCSDDDTPAIVRSYDDPSIRLVASRERLGIGEARNRAMREAKGDWIAFLDQDDLWLPNKLRLQAERIGSDREGKLGLVYGRTRRFSEKKWLGGFDPWHGEDRLPEGDIHGDLLRKPSFVALSSACVRRSAIIELGSIPAEVRCCPDYYMFLALSREWRAAAVQSVCCLYRVHPASMSKVYAGNIHKEVYRIAQLLAREEEQKLLPHRARVRDVLLARTALRQRDFGAAKLQLGARGALAFALYPLVRLKRDWRRRERGGLKYRVIENVRKRGLLRPFDELRFAQRKLQFARSNRRFAHQNVGFALPPPAIAFDAYNMVDWVAYRDGGLKHAQVFADAMLTHSAGSKIDVLEWGCGPGRIIRHVGGLLGDRAGRIAGSDYNGETIAWCKANLAGIDFEKNELAPPLPFADDSFDVVYNFSVFTHLSEGACLAWAAELHRVLRPGGLLLSTTHGDNYTYLLTRVEELRAYARGRAVSQSEYAEGRKWFFGIHSPAYVQGQLLRDFDDVEKLPVPAAANMLQDLWIARKPAALPQAQVA